MKATPNHTENTLLYEIRLQGHLDEEWQDWFNGFTVLREAEGTTCLRGTIRDQSDLHGVLKKVRDLGIPLLSLNHIEPINQKQQK